MYFLKCTKQAMSALKAYLRDSKEKKQQKIAFSEERTWDLQSDALLSELTWQMVVEGFLTCLFVDEPIAFWTQRGEHQAGIAKDPISILNGDNLFLLNLFCFPICKPSMATLPTVCNYEKKVD